MEYLGAYLNSTLSLIFTVFFIAALGYTIGAVEIKGISLGTAGVLVTALIFGMVVSAVPSFTVGGITITLFDASVKSKYSLISGLGTAMFVTSIGLIAGPTFFRGLNRKYISYVVIGIIAILSSSAITVLFIVSDNSISPSMAVGLMTGALTSTPGLSAAKEVAPDADLVTAGYGIAYLFGVLGVVLFVQLMPKLLHTDVESECKRFVAAETAKAVKLPDNLYRFEPNGTFPFVLAISLGCIIGAMKIPGLDFTLGNSGGCLLSGLIIGHYGHVGYVDLRVSKSTLNFFRELGLVLFLIGAGVPGGVNFIVNIKMSHFVYGMLMTIVPMLISYLIATKCYKIDIFNSLGAITGGMTSTPALGVLIRTAGTDEVSSAYAATYPIALVAVVISSKLILLLL